MKLALMIIDMQKEFYVGQTKEQMDRATEYINYVIPMFEERGLPIIWVQDKDEGEGVVPGKEGFEFIDALKPKPDAIRIHKTYGNSFNKTDVEIVLAPADSRALDPRSVRSQMFVEFATPTPPAPLGAGCPRSARND